ncbi:MAG: outer membrane protein assembly factor BamE [Pseudomonadota bacterium]
MIGPRTGKLFLASLAVVALVGCSPITTVHGYVPSKADLETIEPGVDTVLSIEERIGRPASSGLLQGSDWYYIQSTMEQVAYNPARVTDRMVVAIGFDPDGVVEDVQLYGLEDGRIVNLSPRVTPTGGQRENVLRRIFGNLLNFRAEQFVN